MDREMGLGSFLSRMAPWVQPVNKGLLPTPPLLYVLAKTKAPPRNLGPGKLPET